MSEILPTLKKWDRHPKNMVLTSDTGSEFTVSYDA